MAGDGGVLSHPLLLPGFREVEGVTLWKNKLPHTSRLRLHFEEDFRGTVLPAGGECLTDRDRAVNIVFFSKMAQGVPSIGPVQRLSGGTFVSDRPQTLRFFENLYPELRRV